MPGTLEICLIINPSATRKSCYIDDRNDGNEYSKHKILLYPQIIVTSVVYGSPLATH